MSCSLAWGVVAPSSGWEVSSVATPSVFAVGDASLCSPSVQQFPHCDLYEVTVTNTGSVASSGEVFVRDVVPAGLEVRSPRLLWPGSEENLEEAFCSVSGSGVSGSVVECGFPEEQGGVSTRIAPGGTLTLVVYVAVEEGATFSGVCPAGSGASTGCVDNEVFVEGGGTLQRARTAAPLSHANLVNGPVPRFGVDAFGLEAFDGDGAIDSVAGDHPFDLVNTVALNTKFRRSTGGVFEAASVEDPRDVVVDLPVGFVGSVLAAPRCTFAQLSSDVRKGVGGCPKDSIVGHIKTEPSRNAALNGPIYNMVPERGMPAEFAFVDLIAGTHVIYSRVVPTAKGYVLQAVSPEVPQNPLTTITVQFYGVPAVNDETGNEAIPFFTNPTSCEGEVPTATIYMDSWQHPARLDAEGMPVDLGEPEWAKAESTSPPMTGCNALQFSAELSTVLSTEEADSPSGAEVGIKVPQPEAVGIPATPALKTASVAFPQGVTLDPSAGNGLAACTANPADVPGSAGNEIGWLGTTGPNGEELPKVHGQHGELLPNRGLENFSSAAPECPKASKLGTLEVESPLTSGVLHGEMYLAAQNANPYGSEVGLYVVINDPVTGVLVKLAGTTQVNEHTGQLTGVFEENPQLPFSNLRLKFFPGTRGAFATPNNCGIFTTTGAFEPFSLEEGEPLTSAFATFPIKTGCVNSFNPSFAAGSTNLQAGGYAPVVVSFQRSDSEQELGGLRVSLPPGLLADVGSVPLCGEEQANAGTCPESSQVGTVLAEAGPGPSPLADSGRVYLTGPYKGGPYGLSVVVPAVAGPFNFGVVVVRQSLQINPVTAAATDVSDALPVILNPKTINAKGEEETIGIPIRLHRVEVRINRPNFTFNPTNCSKLQVGGQVTSTQGLSVPLETPFKVTNCSSLKFTPKFTVSTAAKTTKLNGASLTTKLTEPSEPQGSQANIAKVKVELPKALPSRLTTLQKACLAVVFEANPANCSPESKIGYATVHTPVLPEPLTGPAIFVSHGGEAFPSLTMILQGNGVKIELVGSTLIKNGITSTTFNTVPDTPFSTFELTLPQGKFSALSANGNLCTQKLVMPTEFIAQNGAEIHQSTPVTVEGCKPQITVTSHKVKGKTATLQVSVPSGGKLVATGKGLSKGTGKSAGAGTITVKLTLSKAEQAFLRKHHARRLKVKINLTFTPKHGSKLKTSTTVFIG